MTVADAAGTPADDTDSSSAAFWEGMAEGRLVVSRCRSCGSRLFPAIATCARCGSADLEAEQAGGEGTIYSWATVHMALAAEFADEVPYTIVAVDLAEGGRMFGRLLAQGAAPVIAAGARVRFESYEVAGRALPGFRMTGLGTP